ncbi:MAG: alanine racemase [Burkholderiaceae bacterium]
MQANIDRMQERMRELGVAFRPHVKTSKAADVVRRQCKAGARGITVSTLKEAERFFAEAIDDILYAVCIAPAKLEHVRALREAGCRLSILVDSLAGAQAVVEHGRAHRHAFDVLIEIDTDGHRSGVVPEDERLLAIGRCLHEGGALLAGVMTHAGGSYACEDEASLVAFAERERAGCVLAARRLRAAGLPCETVSVGSTPTALSARSLEGVTEVRAGVYVFFDLVMAGIGVCTPAQIALSVLTTVIGHQADRGRVIVDAGWMALSRDRGTRSQRVDHGYGLVCDRDGQVLDPYIVVDANQEHGIIAPRPGAAAPDADVARRFPIGTLLRVLPNHACATAAQFDAYHVLPAMHVWPRFGGW